MKIGIIGGGVGGVSLCLQLKNKFLQSGLKAKIFLFEKKSSIGVGMPYDNREECYRININKQLMEPLPDLAGQFSDWILASDYTLKKTCFPPRYYFADYLQTIALQMQREAKEQGLDIHFMTQQEVWDITPLDSDHFEIYSTNEQNKKIIHVVNAVVLCLGSLPSSNYRQYLGESGYCHNPWENIIQLPVTKSDAISILGSKLTAIDVALKLQEIKHTGPIYIASPSGLLPTVKANPIDYPLKTLTPENFRRLLLQRQITPIRLEDLISLFVQELQECFGNDFNLSQFLHKITTVPAFERLEYEINQVNTNQVKWQKIMSAAYQYLSRLWPYLNLQDRMLFQKKYYSVFMTFLCAIPLESATQIHQMIVKNQLRVFGGLDHITLANNIYTLNFKNGSQLHSKYLINASGSGDDLTAVALLKNLLQSHQVIPNALGGLKVSAANLKLFNGFGKQHQNWYAMGELVKGDCFNIIEIGRIAEQAKIIANHLISSCNEQPSKRRSGQNSTT